MRIISQGGHADLPYEQTVIYMDYENIMARIGDKEYLLGRYKTMEQAEKVMSELHHVYEYYMAEATPDGNGFCFIPPSVFHFPKAEDVE